MFNSNLPSCLRDEWPSTKRGEITMFTLDLMELHAEQKSVLKWEINGGVKLAISIIPVVSVRINEDEGCPDACEGMKSGGLIW